MATPVLNLSRSTGRRAWFAAGILLPLLAPGSITRRRPT